MKDHQVSAERLLSTINHWRSCLLPIWATERKIESYANGGPPPMDDETCESDIVPLGFAQSYMKKEVSVLIDPLLLDPGIIDAKLVNPAINKAERTTAVETHVNIELNRVVKSRMSSTLLNVAGRATVTGRATVFRKSKNDWVFKCGRLIHPIDAGADLLDSTFREWAFAEQLTLRDIESHMGNASKGKYGWDKEGLEQLKLWIMASEAEKYSRGNLNGRPAWVEYYDPDIWLQTEISDTPFARPVDVFWYFRKNGKITKNNPRYGGHEKVDLYCISRFGSESSIKSEMSSNGTKLKWMANYTDTTAKDYLKKLDKEYRHERSESDEEEACELENDRLLFYLPDAFDSIEQCLILHVDDAAVSGDQKVSDVKGSGVTAMPKLAAMEGLMTEVIGGIAFGAGYHFTAAPGTPQEYLNQIERSGGVRSGQVFPSGVDLLNKVNSFAGLGPAANFIRMMDAGIAADSASANQGNFGGSQPEFASQANAELGFKMSTVTRRLENWLQFLARVSEQVARTLCRPWPEMKPEYPCYQDAQRLRLALKNRFGIHEDEWDSDRWDYSSRRLAGNMTRQQSVAVNTQLIQVIGPIMPSVLPFLAKEILRATLGDVVANQLTEPNQEEEMAQVEHARNNVAVAFVTGQSPAARPMDDPVTHLRVAGEVVEGRIKAAMAAGQTTQAEVIGVVAILGYAGQFATRLPEQLAEAALTRIDEMGKAIQSIPQQAPAQEGAMSEKDRADMAIKAANQDRLNRQLDLKAKNDEIKTLTGMRKLSNSEELQRSVEKNMAAQRAQTYTDIEASLAELNTLPAM